MTSYPTKRRKQMPSPKPKKDNPKNNEDAGYSFHPDLELIAFAHSFAFSAEGDFEIGEFISVDHTYKIEVVEGFPGSSKINPARASTSGIVEISLLALNNNKHVTPDYLFYLVLWSFCVIDLNKKGIEDPVMKADIPTLKWCYDNTNLSVKKMIEGIIEVLKDVPSEYNIKRQKQLAEFIKSTDQ